jgi:hypothetical protein
MHPKVWVVLIAAALGCGAGASAAATAAEDRAQVLAYTASLEREPLAADARAKRQWLIQWIAEVPDLQVDICDPMDILQYKKSDAASQALVQSMFGNAAYQIEHPEAKHDSVVVQEAGVNSALNAYEATLAQGGQEHLPVLDALLAARQEGKLSAALAPQMKKSCKLG